MEPEALAKGRERAWAVVLCAAFVAVLMVSYETMDSKAFAFLGLVWSPPPLGYQILSYVLAAAPALWMPIRLTRPSQVAYWILYLTVIVPVMLVPYHVSPRDPAEILAFTGVVWLCFAGLGVATRLPTFEVPRPVWDRTSYVVALAAGLFGVTMAVWAVSGFVIDLDWQSMYRRRHAAREVVTQQTAMAYLKGNLASALQPFALAVGVVYRSWALLALAVFAGAVVFSLEGSKTSALLPVFVVMLLPAITWGRRHFGLWLPALAIGLVIAVMALYSATNLFAVPTLTTWRLFHVKALLTAHYYEFFTANPLVYMSDGLLSAFVPPQYDMATPRLIGLTYFGNVETNANANVWASAFADFGYGGMMVATVVLGFLFRFFDSLARNRSFVAVALVAAFAGLKWSDGSLDTSLLSHGVLLSLLLVYLFTGDRPVPRPAEATA
jgi:oligosaccharide repeat unit polymerase